ncbi:hypothetical protein AC578_2433 [Pseudocercospora eumusae]|uniref:Uncharacterized protein n=1 Tax=Pseudocercospora eumusae TaxID=321146 RepID=A0A139HXU1_9PEZI|nr:hypothetical protein AC578_2433 [Pseudocercospora eumusae]
MPVKNYVAATGTMDDTKTNEHRAKSEKQKRKTAESYRYYLRRRQSNFTEAVATAPSKALVEKAEATDRHLLQQLFVRTTISTTHDSVETACTTGLEETRTRDEDAEMCAAESSSADSNSARSTPDVQPRLGKAESLGVLATEESHGIRHDSLTENGKGKQRKTRDTCRAAFPNE